MVQLPLAEELADEGYGNNVAFPSLTGERISAG